jgi:hypothetical protein
MAANLETFTAAGADPATAAELLHQHNTMVGAPTGHGPPTAAPLAAPANTPAVTPGAPAQPTAQAQIDDLIARRAAGTIGDYEWRTEHEPRLQELIRSAAESTADPLQQHLDVAYAPPRNALGYDLPVAPGEVTDEQITANRNVGEAMLAESIPTFIGRNIGADVEELMKPFEGQPMEATQAALARHRDNVRASLTRTWGAAAEANFGLIRDYAQQFAARHPRAAEYVEMVPYLSANTLVALHTWLTTSTKSWPSYAALLKRK